MTSTVNASNVVSATGSNGSMVSISVNGNDHINGEPAVWNSGENLVSITVKNGSAQRVYTVAVTKAEGGNG